MKLLLIILSLLIIISCTDSSENAITNQKNDSIIKKEIPQSGKKANSSNEAIVNENCVIFLWPDSTEIEKMKAENSEEDYNEIVADLTWYPGVAAEVLDSFKIKNISCDEEYIILRNSKNEETKLKRKEIEGDMILFRIDKDPIFSSAIEFDKDLTLKYFDKK